MLLRKLLLAGLQGLFLSFSLFLNAYATDNPALISYPPEKRMGFRGLDTLSPQPLVENGRATDVLNVKLSPSFDLKKRYGYSLITGRLDDLDMASPSVTGIFDTEYSNGNSWTLAFVGQKLKYDNTTTWSEVTGGLNLITSGQDNQWQCVMALDNAICTNEVDRPIKVTSTPTKSAADFTGLTSAITKARAVIWYRNYLIYGNTTEGSTVRPTRFRWSDVGTIGTFTDANFVDISSLSGDEIVSFKELYGELYIFMRKSIWKATLVGGNDVFVFTKIIDGLGAIAKGSVQVISLKQNKSAVVFLSEDKKVLLFNGVVLEDLGFYIQPTLDDLNASRLQYAVGVFDGKSYFLSVSSSGSSTNDLTLELQTEIFEWTKHDQIDANALARVKESTSVVKTYFGNYSAFVYWLDNSDNLNDVDGATGIVDSVGVMHTDTITGGQVIIDTGITTGIYTGAIIRITSGTGVGEERVVLSGLTTGVLVSSAFATTPDSTSNYSIGDINAYYTGKWYDFDDAPRFKSYRGMFMWAAEASSSEVTFSYAEDYGATIESTTKNLSPSSNSLWDSALWDVATWGTTGDKMFTFKLTGRGRVIQPKWEQNQVDKTFHLYGYHFLADRLDRE